MKRISIWSCCSHLSRTGSIGAWSPANFDLRGRGLNFFPIIGFFLKPSFGFEFFSKNVNVVLLKRVIFFLKSPFCYTKTFSFRENLHFNNSKRVFLAFCTIFMTNGRRKSGNARNSNKAKSGVSRIHLRQLFHFINVRCNYCVQLSWSYQRFLQRGLKRRFFVL